VGHSFGARATVEAALLRRDRVSRLVLVDPALTLGTPAAPGRITRAVLAAPPLRDALVAATATNPRMTARLTRALIARKDAATQERVAMLQRPMRVRGSTAALGRYLATFMTDTSVTASGRAATYRALAFPTVLIWGAEDTLTPLTDGQRLQALIPGARLTVLPGVGHIPALEDPAALNRALLEGIR
jgi:pimeloyl-ACP methyl ester carboxylesterase